MTEEWKNLPQFESINGSRLYGIHTEESDWDFMGAVIEPPEYVLGLKTFEQHEWKDDTNGQHSEGITYSLKKYIKLLKEGNPSVLCTMFTPDLLISNSSNIPACACVDSLGIRTSEFHKMIVSQKAGPKFLGYMRSQMQRLESGLGMHVTRKPNQFGYDSKYAGHILRLGWQGIEYLMDGKITLPMHPPLVKKIMEIRNGNVSLEDFLDQANRVEDALKAVIDKNLSQLPPEPNHDAINEWLVETYRKYWT